ncbi:MAG: hypothetical protein R3222_08600 [Balneolaceae bacterium]|nr:hypothetical protein [Balneolaceae bacterium]
MTYLFILLSAACSLLIAHLLKVTEVKKLRTLNTLTINYISAAIIALIVGIGYDGGAYRQEWLANGWTIWLFTLAVGFFFISNFIAYSKSVHLNGVGITITGMRLSLLIPVLLSVYVYDEYLTLLQTTGVLLVFIALVLLIPKKSTARIGNISAGWLLLIIFLLSGFADASLKIYKEEFSNRLNELHFMAMVFLGAFVIGAAASLYRKGPFCTREELKLGIMIGIPNLYSAIFLIYALDDITGSIAYPMVNMLSVAGGTALGLIRWDDSISSLQWAGLIIAVISILILL